MAREERATRDKEYNCAIVAHPTYMHEHTHTLCVCVRVCVCETTRTPGPTQHGELESMHAPYAARARDRSNPVFSLPARPECKVFYHARNAGASRRIAFAHRVARNVFGPSAHSPRSSCCRRGAGFPCARARIILAASRFDSIISACTLGRSEARAGHAGTHARWPARGPGSTRLDRHPGQFRYALMMCRYPNGVLAQFFLAAARPRDHIKWPFIIRPLDASVHLVRTERTTCGQQAGRRRRRDRKPHDTSSSLCLVRGRMPARLHLSA